MDQSETHLLIFLKPVRHNLAPGFPRALYLSPLNAQKSSGSRLQQTPAITAQFYCRSKSRYNGHQLAFFSITSLQNLLIMIHSFNRGFAERNPYIQNMP